MSASEARRQKRVERCLNKIRYSDWEQARYAGLAVYLKVGLPGDANAPTPYPCDLIGEAHYHVGHLRFGERGTPSPSGSYQLGHSGGIHPKPPKPACRGGSLGVQQLGPGRTHA